MTFCEECSSAVGFSPVVDGQVIPVNTEEWSIWALYNPSTRIWSPSVASGGPKAEGPAPEGNE